MSGTASQTTIRTIARRLAAAAPAICIAAIATATPAVALPPVEQRAEELFAVLRGGAAAASATFVTTALHADFLAIAPVPAHVEQLGSMRESLGAGFEIDGIMLENPHRGRWILRSAGGEQLELSLEVEPIAPYRIVGLGMGLHDPGREVPEFESLEHADRFLDELAADDRFGGVVLVARDGEPNTVTAYGRADREREIANTASTTFDVGSITKDFTAVAILQLAERGALDLDAPMGRYLEGFPESIASRVRVIDLLKMESGYGDYFTPEFAAKMASVASIDDYLEHFRTLELEFEPRTNTRYSNVGYVILGGIVEAVSGMPYHTYVSKRVFKPAGMKRSGFPRRTTRDPRRAVGYTEDFGEAQPNAALFPPTGSPAGGSYSTAADLLRFQRALRANRLLGARMTTWMINGFEDDEKRSPTRGIAGGAPGVSAVSLEDAKAGLNVIVLSNTDEPFAEQVGSAIFRMLRDDARD